MTVTVTLNVAVTFFHQNATQGRYLGEPSGTRYQGGHLYQGDIACHEATSPDSRSTRNHWHFHFFQTNSLYTPTSCFAIFSHL